MIFVEAQSFSRLHWFFVKQQVLGSIAIEVPSRSTIPCLMVHTTKDQILLSCGIGPNSSIKVFALTIQLNVEALYFPLPA